MEQVTLKIDGEEVKVDRGATVLEAAEKIGIKIPTLCYHPALEPEAGCRICVVQLGDSSKLTAACATQVEDNMEIKTKSKLAKDTRKTNLELILANHPLKCTSCWRNLNCELQELAHQMGVEESIYAGRKRELPVDDSSAGITREPEKCIHCGRCINVCSEIQSVDALGFLKRGFETEVGTPPGINLADSVCVQCGQCAAYCPVGAIYESTSINDVWEAIYDPQKHVIVQTAPAVQVSLGEELGASPGISVTGKMISSLRKLGFDRVFSTEFTADVVIMEEGHELLDRINKKGPLPLITSCSPGWIKFIEHFYPDLLDYVSTSKSPQQAFGALAKSYYPGKKGIDPESVFVVSVMPCTAKKFEAKRPEMENKGLRDVDAVLTTRELSRMIKEAGIDFWGLEEGVYDNPLGIQTGAATIFGATGGVCEAALRTVYELVNEEELPSMEFEPVRGLNGIKEANTKLGDMEVKVAVINGLKNARTVLDELRNGRCEYDFIEIMACPGGCIGGGGQPIPSNKDVLESRIKAIYQVDEKQTIRKSHENPAVKELYRDFLEKPLGHKSHELLHTKYFERNKL
ncbi:NADH-dependent [FeFe] hydrogenase, group A6 [Natranaerofaba carboxydovora]|uniref:NADH-dependent [FeFe] hydrogenase, group A6 n=1 Tax=Natranaerofaba carboxydovora TaxID=2742683 RepID=UPI001F149506|nr:NADH-dependent [FeFe] hydrogenase, group A6 [Natranaerofaba carboxydovora]UMZ72774.1 NADP-reducing hydrogenase subunit HndC [Natranaerofaba carboxydovora]